MTLAQQLVNRQKTKEDLIDDGFTKTSFRDKDGLPAWYEFVLDSLSRVMDWFFYTRQLIS